MDTIILAFTSSDIRMRPSKPDLQDVRLATPIRYAVLTSVFIPRIFATSMVIWLGLFCHLLLPSVHIKLATALIQGNGMSKRLDDMIRACKGEMARNDGTDG